MAPLARRDGGDGKNSCADVGVILGGGDDEGEGDGVDRWDGDKKGDGGDKWDDGDDDW